MEAEPAWEGELFLDELDIGGVLLIDDERLGSVIGSLEAEISSAVVLGGDEDDWMVELCSIHDSGRCEDCRMEDILTGGGSLSTTSCLVEGEAEWTGAAGDQSPGAARWAVGTWMSCSRWEVGFGVKGEQGALLRTATAKGNGNGKLVPGSSNYLGQKMMPLF